MRQSQGLENEDANKLIKILNLKHLIFSNNKEHSDPKKITAIIMKSMRDYSSALVGNILLQQIKQQEVN